MARVSRRSFLLGIATQHVILEIQEEKSFMPSRKVLSWNEYAKLARQSVVVSAELRAMIAERPEDGVTDIPTKLKAEAIYKILKETVKKFNVLKELL